MSTASTIQTRDETARVPLPARGSLWLTDAGLETELVFKDGLELPHFSSAVLLDSAEGRKRLRRYYADFVELADHHGLGLVLETATWRISPDWAERLGFDDTATTRIQRDAVRLLRELRDAGPLSRDDFVVSGNLGPRYDGYRADDRMSPEEAFDYHHDQVALFAAEGADVVSALTLTTSDEAIGIARAATTEAIPAVLSFTVETDGRLPSGENLGAAIASVDAAAPGAVAYYGINCAHPTHFLPALEAGDPVWRERIGAVRANASKCSHAELDESTELDEGDPGELASHSVRLRDLLPGLRVVGGCCGTDVRHVTELCRAFVRDRRPDSPGLT
jgi:S-methylmethionine-dependent homocysteine/selenocysteine methylase